MHRQTADTYVMDKKTGRVTVVISITKSKSTVQLEPTHYITRLIPIVPMIVVLVNLAERINRGEHDYSKCHRCLIQKFYTVVQVLGAGTAGLLIWNAITCTLSLHSWVIASSTSWSARWFMRYIKHRWTKVMAEHKCYPFIISSVK